jgi:hypothetical protein
MVVLDPFAARTLPVTGIILRSIMARRYPERAFVWRTAVITVVPLVLALDRVPIPSNPGVSFARTSRLNDDPRRRRCPDVYAERDPGEDLLMSVDMTLCVRHDSGQTMRTKNSGVATGAAKR